MHLDLTTSAQSVAGTSSSRSYGMITADPTTVVSVLAADAVGATGLAGGVLITLLTAQSPRAQVNDSSTYVYYALTQGAAPAPIWMDATDGEPGVAVWAVVGPMTSAYTALAGQLVLVSTTAGSVAITLPSAAGALGQRVGIKDSGGAASTNAVTLATVGAQTVDGAAAPSIATNHGSLTLVSDGSNWWSV